MEFQDSSATSRVTALGNTCVLGLGSTGQAVARYLAKRLGTRISSVTVFGGKTSQANDETRALQEMGCTVVLGTDAVEGSYDLTGALPGISEFSPSLFLLPKLVRKKLFLSQNSPGGKALLDGLLLQVPTVKPRLRRLCATCCALVVLWQKLWAISAN